MKKSILIYFCSALVFTSVAQKKEETPNKAPLNWYLQDPSENGIYGVGAERAYELSDNGQGSVLGFSKGA